MGRSFSVFRKLILPILCLALAASGLSYAQTLYKYRGENGEWIYTDRKPVEEKKIDNDQDEEDDIKIEFDDDKRLSAFYWLIQFGFHKQIILKLMNQYQDQDRYMILEKLMCFLIAEIGNKALKESLNLKVDENMLKVK